LLRGGEHPGVVAQYAELFRHMAVNGSSPVLEMLTVASSRSLPICCNQPQPSRMAEPTDERWHRIARELLPSRTAELREHYPRRIAWLTLRRELERYAQARLPAVRHIPKAARYIASFLEDREEHARRVVARGNPKARQAAA
jgi:hypothetical protein